MNAWFHKTSPENRGALLLVLGNEGRGLRQLVKQQCDWDVRIDGTEQVESLNVSVAAALACYQLGS